MVPSLWNLIILVFCWIKGSQAHTENPLLLLVSFDGFRWDYLHKVSCLKGKQTPNFDKLRQNGVFVRDGVKNAYITKTFPNHYSIVTGLYEESHGVIANNMYDPKYDRQFHPDNDSSDPFWFDNGTDTYEGFPEPIWLTNEKGGHHRYSGVMFWPGSEAKGMTASRYMKYNRSLPFRKRIDNVINWFITEENPINLGLLYFNEPDHTGHQVGPDSEAMVDLIVELDQIVGYLIEKLNESNLISRMNIIITSDHGMAEITNKITLDDFVDPTWYTEFGGTPIWNILPNDGKEDAVYSELQKVPNLKTYKKEDIPDHYHYKNNRRVMPIVIEASEGYTIVHNATDWTGKGNHGYDNGLSSMHPIFIASGPAFKKNFTSSQFNNVDIYELICHILHVKAAPNNGSFDNIKQVLYVEEGITITSVTLMATIVFCALVSGVCCVSTSRLYLRRRPLRPSVNTLSLLAKAGSAQTDRLLSESEEEFA